jgi:polar amino acid transport system substrate-binding protein
MKLRLVILSCAVALGVAFLATSFEATAAGPGGCSRLVLTGHPSYPPVAWAHGDTLDGAGIEIVRRLAEDSGIPISVVNEGSWDAAQQAVKTGKADAIVGLYLTHKRLASFDYVQPAIAPDPSAVLVRAGERFDYTGWDSLIGKRGVLSDGEEYGPKFDAFMKTKLTMRRVRGFQGVYQALIDNEADYGLAGYYAALTAAPKTKIAIAAPNFVTEGLYLAFGKNSACSSRLSTAFSKDIAKLIADGTVKKLFATGLADYQAMPH